jgi:glycosyl transferase family 25
MTRFFEHIDRIVYINLDERPDRDQDIRREFERLRVPPKKIQRFPAIRHETGAIGCSMSHARVMELAVAGGWRNVLVLEDDFSFIRDTEKIDEVIRSFFSRFPGDSWDVLNLTRGYHQRFEPAGVPWLRRVVDVSTTSGFLVNGHFYRELLDNFREGLERLSSDPTDREAFCIDRYWRHLMPRSAWYITVPSLGYQREGFSTIENRPVDYRSFDGTLAVPEALPTRSLLRARKLKR